MVSCWQNGLLSLSVADGFKTYDWSVLHTNCNLMSFYSVDPYFGKKNKKQAVLNLQSADVPLFSYQ